MLRWGGVIVEDHVDHLSGGDFGFDDVEKADELLMAMTLHAAPVTLLISAAISHNPASEARAAAPEQQRVPRST